MPQPLDVVVDRAVLLDVGVGLRDVRLGLVVVVVRHEVLDGVVGQHLSELVGQLGGQRLVGRHDQRGPLQLLDQPGGGRRLAGTGGTQQHDVALPRVDAAFQFVDGRGLVAGRRVLADHLELAAGAHDVIDGAVLRVRHDGIFGSESHVHQVRTNHRQAIPPCPAPSLARPRVVRLAKSIPPNARPSTSPPAPTPIPRASCGTSTCTPCTPGASTWPGRRPGRAQFHYLESWLLPSLSLRVTVFHFNPGYERDQDFYLDVGPITVDGRGVAHRGPLPGSGRPDRLGRRPDRRRRAVRGGQQGLVTPETASAAVQTAVAAIDGLARTTTTSTAGWRTTKWSSPGGQRKVRFYELD